jgi:uncharacterized membrane protein
LPRTCHLCSYKYARTHVSEPYMKRGRKTAGYSSFVTSVVLYTRKCLLTSLWSMVVQRSFVSSVTSAYLTTRDHRIGSCNGLARDAVYDFSSIREW